MPQAQGEWSGGPEGGLPARCHAARLLSDLCGLPESREAVVGAGLLDTLVGATLALVSEWRW